MDFSFTDQQHVIAETFDRFCDKELSYDYVRWMDENVDFPPDELWNKFADLGLFAATVPAEYGGQGLGLLESMIAYEQICKRSMSVALAVGVTTGFGTRFLAELGVTAVDVIKIDTEGSEWEILTACGEELIATNSMILHELFFDGLGDESAPGRDLAAAMARDFGSAMCRFACFAF